MAETLLEETPTSGAVLAFRYPPRLALKASDLAAQVNREFERQRGWCRAADGFYGPAPIASLERRGA